MCSDTHSIPTRMLIILLAVMLQSNISIAGPTTTITPQDLIQNVERGTPTLIIDVRTPREFAEGHVPGAVNIPHTEVQARLSELHSKIEGMVVVYCETGRRAAIAQGILEQAGIKDVVHLEGDMAGWRRQGMPQE